MARTNPCPATATRRESGVKSYASWSTLSHGVNQNDSGFVPVYLRGDLPSSNETLAKMGEVLSKPGKHTHRLVKYFNKGKRAYELDEFRYTLCYIDWDWDTSRDKLLASLPQEAKPENGNEAGKCVYSKYIFTFTDFYYEKIETGACKSQNTKFVCQMELEKES